MVRLKTKVFDSAKINERAEAIKGTTIIIRMALIMVK